MQIFRFFISFAFCLDFVVVNELYVGYDEDEDLSQNVEFI